MKEPQSVTPDRCAHCGGELLYVFYYGDEDQPIGGHRVCANCGPRSVVEMTVPVDVRRKLLERKAS